MLPLHARRKVRLGFSNKWGCIKSFLLPARAVTFSYERSPLSPRDLPTPHDRLQLKFFLVSPWNASSTGQWCIVSAWGRLDRFSFRATRECRAGVACSLSLTSCSADERLPHLELYARANGQEGDLFIPQPAKSGLSGLVRGS